MTKKDPCSDREDEEITLLLAKSIERLEKVLENYKNHDFVLLGVTLNE